MIYAKILSHKDKLDDVNKILYEVFVEEYKYSNEDIFSDTSKLLVFHVVIYEGMKEGYPIATGRLTIDKQQRARLKWIAVEKKHRRKQYGDMAIRMLVEKARSLSCSEIEADVPEDLTEMFKKIGFLPSKVKGSRYIRMVFNDLHLNACQIK